MFRILGFGDVRRIGQLMLLVAIVQMTAGLDWTPEASAQGFGWGFYRAPAPRRRSTRRHAPPQTAVPLGAAPPDALPAETAKAANVPLPVPRPHFPGDPPGPTDRQPETPGAIEAPLPPPVSPGTKAPGPEPSAETKAFYGPFKPASAVEKPPQAMQAPAPVLPASPPLPPPKPPELANPNPATGVAPSGAKLGEVPGQPADDETCLDRIKARGVEAEAADIGPQPDARCTVVRPVHLIGLTLRDGSKITFPEHPIIACPTADAFSLYIRDLLAPLAKGSYGASVASVWTGPGLECRSRDHIFGAKLSAHGQGLAIDIAQLKLGNGRMIEVGRPTEDLDEGFESAARAGACGYFHTVLGPGTDEYHRTHWHFDLEVRGAHGDSKYCK